MSGAERPVLPLARGRRHSWMELPPELRERVEAGLGARVVNARSRRAGFSPGVAASITLSDGRRAFVKAVLGVWNPETLPLHRREAEIAGQLPGHLPAPKLLMHFSDQEGAVLAFQHVPGHLPRLPWRPPELQLVLEAVDRLAHLLTPSPVDCGPLSDSQVLGGGFLAIQDLLDRQPASAAAVDPWVLRYAPLLAELESGWRAAAVGNTLCHFDLRQDNILIDSQRVTFVDWPHAQVGPLWLDLAAMLPSVAQQGGPEPWTIFDRHPLAKGADRSAVVAVVAAFAGYFVARSLLPPPPGIPTVRAFQRSQGEAAIRWLQRLWPRP